MTDTRDESVPIQPAETVVDAIVARDRAALRAALMPSVVFRALIPPGLREASSGDKATELILSWFSDASAVELLEQSIGTVGPRQRLSYRLAVVEEGQSYEVEQVGYLSVAGGLVERFDLLCSGFHPVGDDHATTRRFDAGLLGCGDGLPRAFREQMGGIGIGDRLEIIARDPAAKADLPSLARLMGHTVLSTDDLSDGAVQITVERRR
jgi:TusA-related sulfurtransferase